MLPRGQYLYECMRIIAYINELCATFLDDSFQIDNLTKTNYLS